MIITAEFHSNRNAILGSPIGGDNLCIKRTMHSDETHCLFATSLNIKRTM